MRSLSRGMYRPKVTTHVGKCVLWLSGSVVQGLWKCCWLYLRTFISSLIQGWLLFHEWGQKVFLAFSLLSSTAQLVLGENRIKEQEEPCSLCAFFMHWASSFLTGSNVKQCHIPPSLGGDKEERERDTRELLVAYLTAPNRRIGHICINCSCDRNLSTHSRQLGAHKALSCHQCWGPSFLSGCLSKLILKLVKRKHGQYPWAWSLPSIIFCLF